MAIAHLPLTAQDDPLRIAVIGLTHTHVHWIFESEKRGEIQIVGIVEPNQDLAGRYAAQHGFSPEKVYNSAEDLLATQKPEAVAAFGTIYDHLEVVETFAPLGIHVMVEKPLAVSLDHARRMADLAREHGIHLLTNYETTWYPTNHRVFELAKKEDAIGPIRKVVVRDGHKGPKQIGVNSEFLEWLTDPKLNGGGALMDFGCYGANLVTWLMEGEKPRRVMAITAQLQPENNPKVEDEAIILLEYDTAVAVIHGSWNWPIGRKDMEVYGTRGTLFADNRHALRLRESTGYDTFREEALVLPERQAPLDDPFAYFRAVVRKEITPGPYDLSSLENNLLVMELLDAAQRSASSGKAIDLGE
jgi:predicted dehydrogenase